MNLAHCVRASEKLRQNSNVDEQTKVFVTHFSHNGNPIHSRVEKLCKPYGFMVAYDGLEVEI
jgi:phosphoribosyl 1,2-cyclic phosphate phosphodiesterase